jgi:hypothetical protein
MKTIAPERVLAIDLHPLSFGYAIFEGPDELLDWGIKSFRHGVNAVKVPLNVKLALLLDHCGPDIVVIKEPRTATLTKMVRVTTNLAQRHRIPVRRISGTSVRNAFPDESDNKYQIASVIAKRYPELSPRLGPRRKLWQAEKYSMSIFDAAALGFAYFICEPKMCGDLYDRLSVPPT